MKIYKCTNCQNTLYFENSTCLHCGHEVGFLPDSLSMMTLGTGNQLFRYCQNAEYQVCNWLLPAKSTAAFCVACSRNRTIPSLFNESNRHKWRNLEIAKHRLFYSLLRLRLPFEAEGGKTSESIVFDFMEDSLYGPKVMTGHDNGVITINLAEADEAQRVRNKEDLGERYRTLLGHFRHEVGHFYWDIFFRNSPGIDDYRRLFGDERSDYAAALATYYTNGAPANWVEHFISPYAASHPWEDWAETWAHYLHMMDTLETAWSFGLIKSDPYSIPDFKELVESWLPLCFAVNSLNRSMGHPDFYPFILSGTVIEKLAFIHGVCKAEALTA